MNTLNQEPKENTTFLPLCCGYDLNLLPTIPTNHAFTWGWKEEGVPVFCFILFYVGNFSKKKNANPANKLW